MVEGLKRFGLVQINSAHVTKDMIGLDAIDHLELTNERGESVQISKPILGVEGDATILTVDPALAVVGGSSKEADEAQPTWPKRKLFQCSYCVRSFSEEEKLVQPSMQSTLTSNTNNYVL